MAVTWKKLAYYDVVVPKSLFSAKGSMAVASGAATPADLVIGNAADVLTVSGGTAVWAAPAAPAAHTLNSHTAAVGAVDFNLQQATDLVVMTVANEAALPVAGVAVGQLCWATGELTLHVCIVAV